MSAEIIVQFVGFQSRPRARDYTFTVRERETEPREYTISIPNEAFETHRARYQDAPDICSHKLHRELAASENHPENTSFRLSDQELDEYRTTHMSKPPKYPYAPRTDHDA